MSADYKQYTCKWPGNDEAEAVDAEVWARHASEAAIEFVGEYLDAAALNEEKAIVEARIRNQVYTIEVEVEMVPTYRAREIGFRLEI
jgi:hypothetical protein